MVVVRRRSSIGVRRSSARLAMGMALAMVSCTARAPDSQPGHLAISATPTVVPLTPRFVNANAFTTRTPIKHVVFLVKENRTFDNLFGTFPGANGVTVGMDNGTRRPLIRGTDGRLPSDIPHCYRCAIQAWDNGKMDGFDQTADRQVGVLAAPPQVSSRTTGTGRNRTSFSTISFPRRGARRSRTTSTRSRRNPGGRAITRVGLPPMLPTAENLRVRRAAAQQKVEGTTPRVNARAGPARASTSRPKATCCRAIPWAYYAADRTTARLHLVRVLRDRPVPERSGALGEYIRPVDDRCSATSPPNPLPPVTWVTPRFELSEHPDFCFCHGENWTTQVVDAIMRSTMWKRHRDLHHVGRLRRLLRSRSAAATSTGWGSASAFPCW